MKLFAILTILTLSQTSWATGPTISCHGQFDDKLYSLSFYQGEGYDATFSLAITEVGKTTLSSGFAHGGSYSECGTRTNPCKRITITDYNIESLKIFFNMITENINNIRVGKLSQYENGYEYPATLELNLLCE